MRWREVILENFWLKAFSLLLATLIWLAARTQLMDNPALGSVFTGREGLREFSSQSVFVLTSPVDGRLFVVDPPAVVVRLSGPATVLRRLNESEVKVFAQAPPPGVAAESVPIRVTAPAGVMVAQLRPEAVRIMARDGSPSNAGRAGEPGR